MLPQIITSILLKIWKLYYRILTSKEAYYLEILILKTTAWVGWLQAAYPLYKCIMKMTILDKMWIKFLHVSLNYLFKSRWKLGFLNKLEMLDFV